MKKRLLSISVAVMLGAFSLTSCVDNEESQSVQNLRDAKAEQLKSLAAMYSAQGEAELIRAKAEAAVNDAIAAMQVLMNEDQSLQNEIAKAAQADKIKAAIADAQKELAIAEKKLAEKIAELKIEQDKVFTAALLGYNGAFGELYGVGGTVGLIQNLNTAKSSLISFKANLISLEEWATKEVARLTIENAQDEALIAQYKTLPDNGIEKLKTDLVAAENDSEVKSEISDQANINYNVANTAFFNKVKELDKYNTSLSNSKTTNTNGDYNGLSCDVWTYEETYVDGSKYSTSTFFDVSSGNFVGSTTTGVQQFGIQVESDYVKAINNLANWFPFATEQVTVNPEAHKYVLDASKNITLDCINNSYKYWSVINTESIKIALDSWKSSANDAIKAKTDSKKAYEAAKAATDVAFAAWEAETDVAKQNEALKIYRNNKAKSNLAFFLMEYNTNNCDGGASSINKQLISTAPAAPDAVIGVSSTYFDGSEEEGVYASNPIKITEVVAVTGGKETNVYGYIVTGENTTGTNVIYTKMVDAYATVTNADLIAQYQAVIDDVEKLNGEDCKANQALQIASYNSNVANSLVTAMTNIINNTTDIAAVIEGLEKDIADNKTTIEAINREVKNPTEGSVEAKQQAIAIQEATIAKLDANIAVQDALLKKFKAEIDALTK